MNFVRNIAEVFTGHTLRSRVDNDPEGRYTIIQAKDLNDLLYNHTQANPHRISIEDIPSNQLLRKGDILLLSKGTNNRAVFYDGQFANAIASSSFTILRLKSAHVKPAFLTWYINSVKAQDYFNTRREGTTTLNLSKKTIEELQVPVPPPAKQDLMIKLIDQYELYKELAAEYENNIKLLIETVLHKNLND